MYVDIQIVVSVVPKCVEKSLFPNVFVLNVVVMLLLGRNSDVNMIDNDQDKLIGYNSAQRFE